MKFTDLSNDSTAICAKYENGLISCLYHDRISNNRFMLNIKCLPMRSCFFSFISGGLINCAVTCIERLDEMLDINTTGFYTLTDSRKISKAARNGAIIAVGLRATDATYLASIRMKDINASFISTPINSENDISLEYISNSEWDRIESMCIEKTKENDTKYPAWNLRNEA